MLCCIELLYWCYQFFWWIKMYIYLSAGWHSRRHHAVEQYFALHLFVLQFTSSLRYLHVQFVGVTIQLVHHRVNDVEIAAHDNEWQSQTAGYLKLNLTPSRSHWLEVDAFFIFFSYSKYSGVARRGRITPCGNHVGATKWRVIRGHQTSHDSRGR